MLTMATSYAELSRDLKEALLETLTHTLSSESALRKQAEDHLRMLEVTDEYGVHLVEIALDGSVSLPVRQMAAVLLKQYIEAHWSENSNKFRLPVCPDSSKAKIRELLPRGLYEPSNKVRSSIAYALSCVGSWDWPEEWPPFFDSVLVALKSGDEIAVHGAIRVLTEFSRDLDDLVISKVAPLLYPELYVVFNNQEKYSIRTRGRVVEVFTNLASVICMTGKYNKNLAKSLLYPYMAPFIRTMLTALHTPDGQFSDRGLKKDVIKALTLLVNNVPRQMETYLPDILNFVWHTLTFSVKSYVTNIVAAHDDSNDPANSDGEESKFEHLIYSLFEFMESVVRHSQHKHEVKQCLPDLLYHLIIYMQLTEDQIENFNKNPDDYVEFEDEESFAYSVRSSAIELFKVLESTLATDFCTGLILAIGRLVEKADADRASGDSQWWKMYESLLFAVSASAEILLKELLLGNIVFDVTNFVEIIVKKSLDFSLPSFLCGKALMCGSELSKVVDTETLQTLLHACTSALQPGAPYVLRISAIRSLAGFCEVFNNSKQEWMKNVAKCQAGSLPAVFCHEHSIEIIKPFMNSIIEGLIFATTQSPSEVMALSLERLALLMTMEPSLSAPYLNRVSSLCLAVFIKGSGDPVLVALVQDLLLELCKHPAASDNSLQAKFFPTLVSILNAPPEKVASGMHSIALDMMTVLVRKCHNPNSETLMINLTFLAVVNRILQSDDLSTQQNGGECLRAFISVASQEILSIHDSDGRNGLQYVVEVCNSLLAPSVPDGSAAFVGRLVTALIRNLALQLGDSLHQLLRGVLSKLLSTETLLVVQNLILVFAQLIHCQLDDVLTFLTSLPGPEGDSALNFVLTIWCSKQPLFFGAYERKVTILALTKLLEHGVLNNDPRLQNIIVFGDQIIDDQKSARTRSKTKGKLEQWTRVPVLVKLFKLIVYELACVLEEKMGKDGESDSEEEEDGWEDEDSGNEECGGVYVSDLLSDNCDELLSHRRGGSLNSSDDDIVEDEEDDDTAADPLSKIEIEQYLTNFIGTFCKHPAYLIYFVPHLNPHEKQVLSRIHMPIQ